MNKDQALQYINNAMSLRTPQMVSLKLFADYLESDAGKSLLSNIGSSNRSLSVSAIEVKTKDYSQAIPEHCRFSGFERQFPSYTFALATGVGKTRLMGAFVAYLFLVYNIQNFMIIAPGNTIYQKLVDDFGKANNPKYVFRGIEEINLFTTSIVTKENFLQSINTNLFGNKIQISIFNIQQFAQSDFDKERGITKAWETGGDSYFDYLKNRKDLVVFMDESHHYHADVAMNSIDRLEALMGFELTATPYTGKTIGRGKDKKPELKKNIFYSYNLGDAIRDGYVKDPWIGTEADVDYNQWDQDTIETDLRKLQLAAFFHERAKSALKEYSLEFGQAEVKPVMLVVAKDTAHASALRTLIDSEQYRGGAYIGKVIEVHSKTSGDESEETISKLLSLENPDNVVEIVIHVNMLKEGWDVANIYTIAPIRSSASEILTEQTIGRGLRLPYGVRTGVKNVDRVMIVAHDNFSKIVEEARHSALIQPSNFESVSGEDMKVIRKVVEVESTLLTDLEQKIKSSSAIMEEIDKRAKQEVEFLIPVDLPEDVKNATIENKKNQLVKNFAKQKAYESKPRGPSQGPSYEDIISKEGNLFNPLTETARKEWDAMKPSVVNIEIPRLMLVPHYSDLEIEDFDLDTSILTRYATEVSIIEERLQGNEEKDLFGNKRQAPSDKEFTRVGSLGGGLSQSPESTLIAALVHHPLIDYEDQKNLLLKLVMQAIAHYKTYAKNDEVLKMVIENNANQIALEIYNQILSHKHYVSEEYLDSGIKDPKPFLEKHSFSVTPENGPVTLESQRDRFPKDKIYNGFTKACHREYKFDSSDEGRLAYLLDRDPSVKNWLRPAHKQFEGLFWRDEQGNPNHNYEPDFVVDLESEVVMVEVKPSSEIKDFNVQAKKATAEKYCRLISESIGKFGITKPWRYIIVPTEKITITSTVIYLLSGGEVTQPQLNLLNSNEDSRKV
jgi:type III restriction enzyme